MKLTKTLKRRIDVFFKNLTDEEMEYLIEKYFKNPKKEQLSIPAVMQAEPEKVCECKCEHPIIRQDLEEYCSVCGADVK